MGNPAGANQWVKAKGEGLFPKKLTLRISEATWRQLQEWPKQVRNAALREWIDKGQAEFDFEEQQLDRSEDTGTESQPDDGTE